MEIKRRLENQFQLFFDLRIENEEIGCIFNEDASIEIGYFSNSLSALTFARFVKKSITDLIGSEDEDAIDDAVNNSIAIANDNGKSFLRFTNFRLMDEVFNDISYLETDRFLVVNIHNAPTTQTFDVDKFLNPKNFE